MNPQQAADNEETIHILQDRLNQRGAGLDDDGWGGSLTRTALDKFLPPLSLPLPGATNPRAVLVDIAESQIGIRETSKNQGPGIAKFWTATNYPDGYINREPYCAAFCCWLILEAMKAGHPLGLTNTSRPKSAAVSNWVSWAGASAYVGIFAPGSLIPEPGDFFIHSKVSHIGLVRSFSGSTLKTIEGNTDGSGSREGDGVYQRTRGLSEVKYLIRLAWKKKAA